MGGSIRAGAGRKARVTAVSVTAYNCKRDLVLHYSESTLHDRVARFLASYIRIQNESYQVLNLKVTSW